MLQICLLNLSMASKIIGLPQLPAFTNFTIPAFAFKKLQDPPQNSLPPTPHPPVVYIMNAILWLPNSVEFRSRMRMTTPPKEYLEEKPVKEKYDNCTISK